MQHWIDRAGRNKAGPSGDSSLQYQAEHTAARDDVDDIALEAEQRNGGAERNGG